MHLGAGQIRDEPSFQGKVDKVEEDIVTGWVLCRSLPNAPLNGGEIINVVCDGRSIGRFTASQPRIDVALHFEADANCGFAIRIPASFCRPGVVVEVFASREDWRLPGCPLSLEDRPVWTLDTLPRAIVGATGGLAQRDLDALKRAADGYALVANGGRMAIPTPTVFPDSISFKVQAPAVYGQNGHKFLDTSAYPDLTIAKLANATCLPRGLIVTASGGVVDECFQSLKERTFHHELDVHGMSPRSRPRSRPFARARPASYGSTTST